MENPNNTDSGTSGDDAASAVPSVDAMISEAVSSSNGAHGNATALDDLQIRLVGDGVPNGNDTVRIEDQPRRRGRPRGSAPTEPRPAARKKAELQSDLEKAQSELAAERARNDQSKIAELAKSIELASYLIFGVAAQSRGPHWGITKPEAEDIGKTGAVALAPYATQLTQHLPWAVFAGTIGKVIYSRVQKDRELLETYGPATDVQ